MRYLIIILASWMLIFSPVNSFEKSKLPTCQGADPTKYNNCFGRETLANGDKYVGEYKNGKPHGNGTYTLANGSKYVGEYKNGLPEGKGTSTYAEGGSYVGEFKNGKPNGYGTATYANGEKYIGEHKDTKRTGKGTYIDALGETFGEWRDDNLVKELEKPKKSEVKIATAKQEQENKLLHNMKPEERRAYICEKTYGFKKGSDRFADCVFKIMSTDAELEKLDKQRRIAEAQLKAEKEKAPAYDPAIGRAAEKAVEIEAARLRREQEEENARLMFALSKGLGTPGGFNSKVQGTVDALNPNQNRRTKRVCNSLRTASGYQTVCKDVPY
jgi:hypothetical protein